MENTKKIMVQISEDLHKVIKLKALQENKTMLELIPEILVNGLN